MEKEIPNDKEITGDFVTVEAINDYLCLPENEELNNNYEYTGEYFPLPE